MVKRIFAFKSILLMFFYVSSEPTDLKIVKNIFKLTPLEQSFITTEGWQELELDRVINSLDRTVTQVGAACLRDLSKPHTDIQKIVKQQNILTKLLTDHKLFFKLKKLLGTFAKKEKVFLGLWDKSDKLLNQSKVFQYNIFRSFLNKNKYLMSLSSFFVLWQSFSGIFSKLSMKSPDNIEYEMRKGIFLEYKSQFNDNKSNETLLNEIVYPQLKYLLLLSKYSVKLKKDQVTNTIKTLAHWHNINKFKYQDKTEGFIKWDTSWTLGDMHQWWQELIEDLALNDKETIDNYKLKLFAWPCAVTNRLWLDINSFWQIKYFYDNLKSTCTILSAIRSRINDLAELLEIFKEIAKCSENLPEFLGLHSKDIEYFSLVDDLLQKFSKLNKKNILLYPGQILVLFDTINKVKNRLIPILKQIGYLDAYCSIAKIIIEHESLGRFFSYAEFKESANPYINFKGLWLPLISKTEPIKNDFQLGTDHINNALFTGPVGSGKSVVMKSVAIAIVLAHSWGILPADSGALTQFIGLRTYLNIKENVSEGKSTFMAEKERIDDIIKFVDSLSVDSFGFLIVDEPYRGTIEVESVNRVWKFGLNLAKKPNILSLIATHLEKPIYLADQTNAFVNYHLEINQLTPSLFKRTFKLKHGPALWWFQDEQKRSAFVDWLCVTPV